MRTGKDRKEAERLAQVLANSTGVARRVVKDFSGAFWIERHYPEADVDYVSLFQPKENADGSD